MADRTVAEMSAQASAWRKNSSETNNRSPLTCQWYVTIGEYAAIRQADVNGVYGDSNSCCTFFGMPLKVITE
jgi:hypothetical protein